MSEEEIWVRAYCAVLNGWWAAPAEGLDTDAAPEARNAAEQAVQDFRAWADERASSS